MGASGCGVLYFVWVFVFCFFRVLLFKSMYAKEVKPLLFYQFGLTGVPGKAPVRHQVVQYHISHVLNPVPEAIFFKFHQLYAGSTNSCCAVTHHWPYVA